MGGALSWITALGDGLPTIFLAGVTWLAARLAVRGDLTVGELVAVYGYVAILVVPVDADLQRRGRQRGVVAARRIIAFLRLPVEEPGDGAAPDGPAVLRDPESGVVAEPGRLTVLAAARPEDAAVIIDRLGRYGETAATWGAVPDRARSRQTAGARADPGRRPRGRPVRRDAARRGRGPRRGRRRRGPAGDRGRGGDRHGRRPGPPRRARRPQPLRRPAAAGPAGPGAARRPGDAARGRAHLGGGRAHRGGDRRAAARGPGRARHRAGHHLAAAAGPGGRRALPGRRPGRGGRTHRELLEREPGYRDLVSRAFAATRRPPCTQRRARRDARPCRSPTSRGRPGRRPADRGRPAGRRRHARCSTCWPRRPGWARRSCWAGSSTRSPAPAPAPGSTCWPRPCCCARWPRCCSPGGRCCSGTGSASAPRPGSGRFLSPGAGPARLGDRAGPAGDLAARGTTDVDAVARTLRDVAARRVRRPACRRCSWSARCSCSTRCWAWPGARAVRHRGRHAAGTCAGPATAYLEEGAANSELAEELAATTAGARTIEAFRLREPGWPSGRAAIARTTRSPAGHPAAAVGVLPGGRGLVHIPVVLVLLVGGLLYLDGRISLGTVVAAALYLRQLIGPMDTHPDLAGAAAEQQRVVRPGRGAGRGAARPGDGHGRPGDDRIEVTGVRYAYDRRPGRAARRRSHRPARRTAGDRRPVRRRQVHPGPAAGRRGPSAHRHGDRGRRRRWPTCRRSCCAARWSW